MQLYEQIEKRLDFEWERDDVLRKLYEGKLDKQWVKSFLKQSFIKFLEEQVKRLVLESQNNPFGQSQGNVGYHRAKFEEIDYYQNIIKELHGK